MQNYTEQTKEKDIFKTQLMKYSAESVVDFSSISFFNNKNLLYIFIKSSDPDWIGEHIDDLCLLFDAPNDTFRNFRISCEKLFGLGSDNCELMLAFLAIMSNDCFNKIKRYDLIFSNRMRIPALLKKAKNFVKSNYPDINFKKVDYSNYEFIFTAMTSYAFTSSLPDLSEFIPGCSLGTYPKKVVEPTKSLPGSALNITKVWLKQNGTLILDWKSYPDAASYNIYSSPVKEGPFELVRNVTDLHFECQNLIGRKDTLFVKVCAVSNGSGNEITESYSEVFKCEHLSQVTEIKYEYRRPGELIISWEPVDGATGYNIKGCSEFKGLYSVIGAVNDCEYSCYSANPNSPYYFKIESFTKNNQFSRYSGYSETFTIEPFICSPDLVSATTDSVGNVSIEWAPHADAEYYQVFKSFFMDIHFEEIAHTTDTYITDSVDDKGLYYYYVSAHSDKDGWDCDSRLSTVIESEILKAPKDFTASYLSKSKIKLKWQVIDSTSAYIIKRKDSTGCFQEIGRAQKNSYTDKVDHVQEYEYTIEAIACDGVVTMHGITSSTTCKVTFLAHF